MERACAREQKCEAESVWKAVKRTLSTELFCAVQIKNWTKLSFAKEVRLATERHED